MLTKDLLLATELTTDKSSQQHLKESAAWGKFLSVTGYIFSGIIASAGIIGGITLVNVYGNHHNNKTGRLIEGGTLILLYLLGAVIIFCMSLFLYRFAKKAASAAITHDQQELTDSLKNLKLYFRFAGVVSIITLLLTILAIAGIMMASNFSR